MTKEAKHRNWWVTLPGRDPFTMGGEPMTEAEALATARGIWPRDELKVEPSIPKVHGSVKPGHD